MPKSKYNTENLTPYKSKWKSGKTKLIRVPESLADKILLLAHQLDNGDNPESSLVTENLESIMAKVDRKEKGYRSNGSGTLIKELRNILRGA